MPWTPERRRRYAPAINDMVRTNATARLATTIDAIDPPARTGRPRLWSTIAMLQALCWPCRAGAAWKLLPALHPPRPTIGSRWGRWVAHGVREPHPGRAQRLPAPGARPQAATLRRHARSAERRDRPTARPPRL